MARDWQPDVEMSLEVAHRLVSEQFPDFSDSVPFYLGRGWDNLCILYPQGVVFRMPTRKMGGDAMEVEIAVLPALAGTLTLPIPEPLYFGEPTPSYPYRFLGCRHVEGTPADSCTVRDEAEAAAVLGSFLRDLHGRAAPPGMPIDPLRKADPQANISRMQRRFSSLTRAQAGERILEWARSEAEFADPGHQMAPSHGDLYPRHVLVGSEGQVSGVIDWGDACLCPPAADLSLAWSMFGEEARETFWAAYGRRLPPTEANAARLRAGMYGLALLAYGLDEEDETASRFGRMALRRILPADLSREALGGSA